MHQDYTRAVINGIYEVIERDGIALFWLLKRPLKKLDKQEFIDDLEIFSSPFLGKLLYERHIDH
ncbi:YcaO-like family protein [Bacillus cereus]